MQQAIRHAVRSLPHPIVLPSKAWSKRATTDAVAAVKPTTRTRRKATAAKALDVPPVASSSKLTIDPPLQSAMGLMTVPQSNLHNNSGSSDQQDEQRRQDFASTGLPMPVPSSSSFPIPSARHPFNTHKFVDELERADFNREAAEAVMRATKSLLVFEETKAAHELVGKGDLENEAYLFKAALGELQTEVMVQARNDGIALRSANGQLQREIDNMQQKLREDVADLKNDISLEFNNRKEDSSTDQKNLELKIIDLSNKFTVSLGELRTDLEANKWLQTRRCLVIISCAFLFVISVYSYAPENPPVIAPPPTANDLGLMELSRTETSPLYSQVRRVGEEEET